MSHINQFKACKDCISSLHQSAYSASQQPYRKADHITLRYFFIRHRLFVSVRQKDNSDSTILHFLFLVKDSSAVPVYMYHLLPGDFPFTVSAFPGVRQSVNIARAFLCWYQQGYYTHLPLQVRLIL